MATNDHFSQARASALFQLATDLTATGPPVPPRSAAALPPMPNARMTAVAKYPMTGARRTAQTDHVDQLPDLLARLTRLHAACVLDQDVAP